MPAIYSHPMFARHQTGPGHPEKPDRLTAAMDGAARAGLEVVTDSPLHAETDRLIAKVHSPEYARELERASDSGAPFFHSFDNPVSPATYAAARTAVGVALHAAAEVWERKNTSSAFVIARPPGHHAERLEAMGFCFFNTIACVAESLLELPGIRRVFILDWDVHHGNGTQHLFEERSDVFYASIHRFPFYPGTGAAAEEGVAEGRGFTRNVPLAGGATDADYLRSFENVLLRDIDAFRPNAILVSAGFDAHRRDPLGGMNVTEEAFGEMTRLVMEASRRHCQGRLLSLLEGGYDPEGLAASVAEHVAAMP
jgi:acetoin utilization deacetylase AcuC-like enzyme